jgi:hypothetical protein
MRNSVGAIDSQGGGIAVVEALHDLDKLRENELPIWPTIVAGKPMDTDGEVGPHIIEMINFSSSEWTSEANHGLRKDFEDKVCILPYFDNLSLGLAEINDEQLTRHFEEEMEEIREKKIGEHTILVEAKTGAKRKLIDYRKSVPTIYNSVKVPGNVWYIPRVRFRMPE